ncbi:MAG: glycosyltransferase family 4 protein [Caldilineaceae bacterium]|nr:glycosyltransferase family 4 protein [Caldilineaceae bacterium]
MKIAIYHNLPSGGAKRALHELMRQLAMTHHMDVYTLTSASHDFADIRPFAAQHRVYTFSPAALLSSPWGRINQALRLGDLLRLRQLSKTIAEEIEQEGYDLVFVHPCQYEKAPSILQHIQAVPKVYYCPESLRHLYETMPVRPYEVHAGLRAAIDLVDPLPPLYFGILSYMDRGNIQSADRVLVNSEYTRKEIYRIYGVDAHVSYLGVDATWFQPRRREREDFVLSVGSLTPLKGFDFLISALATIPAGERPPLVIASNFQDPAERTYLTGMAASCGVDLCLEDNISDEFLVDLYNRAQITLYAPVREPFGLVALESMACGTPIVAVAEGGVRETVTHGKTGLLTERDPHKFGAAVQQLLSNPALAARLGRNGRQQVERNWSWEDAAIRLENHLTTLPRATRSFGNRRKPEIAF